MRLNPCPHARQGNPSEHAVRGALRLIAQCYLPRVAQRRVDVRNLIQYVVLRTYGGRRPRSTLVDWNWKTHHIAVCEEGLRRCAVCLDYCLSGHLRWECCFFSIRSVVRGVAITSLSLVACEIPPITSYRIDIHDTTRIIVRHDRIRCMLIVNAYSPYIGIRRTLRIAKSECGNRDIMPLFIRALTRKSVCCYATIELD